MDKLEKYKLLNHKRNVRFAQQVGKLIDKRIAQIQRFIENNELGEEAEEELQLIEYIGIERNMQCLGWCR